MDQILLPSDMLRASQPSQHKEHKDADAGKKPDNHTMDDTMDMEAHSVRGTTAFGAVKKSRHKTMKRLRERDC